MRKVTRTPYNPYSIGECLEYASSGELALTYVNEDGETVTFSPDDITKDVLERFRDRVILAATGEELTDYEKWMLLKNLLDNFWARRGVQYGRLMDAVLKTYDPISNYDRHESGGWTDTNILGARSGSDTATDVYGAKGRTTTETPGVTDTITETPGVTTTRTDTPATTETVTETPGVSTTTTETPAVTTTNTRTDNLSENVTETPRVTMTTTNTPGVAMTTATERAGDNSSSYRAVERVTVSPDGVHSDITTVEPTSGTNQTAKTNTGTETNQETKTGTNTTVEAFTGSNSTATVMSGTNTSVESFTGNNQSVHARTGSNTVGVSENAYTDNHTNNHTQASATDTNTRLFNEYHVFGNIGVTTSAQMLTGEIELRGALDLITHAIVEFVDQVSVYF